MPPQANPFLSRIIHISQDDKSKKASKKARANDDGDEEEEAETLDIKEFAALMSVFSIRATREQKLRYAFRIYDCDDDGKIGKDDLQQTLEVITNDKMEPEFMAQVVEQVTLYPACPWKRGYLRVVICRATPCFPKSKSKAHDSC